MQKILLSNLSKFSLLQIGLILKKYSNHLVTLLTTSWRTLRKDFCIWRRVFSRLFKQERELDWWLTWKIDSIRRTENLFFLYGRVQASDWQERSTAVCYDRCLSILTSLKKNLGSFHSGIRHLLWKHVRVRENRTSYEDGDDDGPFCLSVDDSLKRKWGLKTISVTRFGNFWKFLVTNHLSKVAQMFGDFCGILKTSLFE